MPNQRDNDEERASRVEAVIRKLRGEAGAVRAPLRPPSHETRALGRQAKAAGKVADRSDKKRRRAR